MGSSGVRGRDGAGTLAGAAREHAGRDRLDSYTRDVNAARGIQLVAALVAARWRDLRLRRRFDDPLDCTSTAKAST